MISRIALVVITVFWLTMNFLLWRSEFGKSRHEGSSVPVAVVWRKILTAPDNSNLEILHHGKKIGDCRLASRISEELSAGKLDVPAMPAPESKSRAMSYRIDLNGGALLEGTASRIHFDFNLKLTTNQAWQEFNGRVSLRPSVWEIHALAAEQAIHLRTDDEDGKSERVLKLADLQNPEAILGELDMPAPLKFLSLSGLLNPGSGQKKAPVSLGLDWQANDDWFEIGHTSVRAYRLKAKFFDRYGVVIIVSRVGEILRVELPDEWVLTSNPLNGA